MQSIRKALQVRNKINDYEGFEPSMLFNKNFHLTNNGNESKPNLVESLPNINLNVNKTTQIFASDQRNQNNANRKLSGCEEDEVPKEEDPYSKIFIQDKSSHQISLLTFQATEVVVNPIYLKHRTFEENENDKCSQPPSSKFFEQYYNKKARRFHQLFKSYKIDNSKNDDNVSVMTFRKALFKKLPTFAIETKEKPTISQGDTNLKQSVINIRFNKIDFKIKAGLLKLKSSIPINFEEEQKRRRLLQSLHMDLPKVNKNKGQVIVNYNGDVLKIYFTLSHIKCSKMKVTSSIGVMAKDNSVYLREFSNITCRTIYIAVPKSNYEFEDVTFKRKQKNQTMKLNKIEPLWLAEQRQKRFKEYYQCRRINPYDDIMELKIGSSICYECFNCINKVKGGTLKCTLTCDEYEKWVRGLQKSEIPQVTESGYEKFESTFSKEVPDWDLVNNTK